MGETPKPGLYQGVPFAEYHLWEAAHFSILKLFSRSAAHAWDEMLHPRAPSKAQDLGHAEHVCIFEPKVFAEQFVTGPKVARRSNADKAIWTVFERQHADKTILKDDDMDLCLSIANAVRAHPAAQKLLGGKGMNEVSIVWVDEATGVVCKARVDRLSLFEDWPFALDLKTTKDASRGPFSKDVLFYHYHQQAGFYLDGLNTLAPAERRWAWIAAENVRPFGVAVYEIEEPALDQGRDEYRKHLEQYKECRATGVWPGYPEELDYLGLPSWAYRGKEMI